MDLPERLIVEGWYLAEIIGEGPAIVCRISGGFYLDPTGSAERRLQSSELEIISEYPTKGDAEAALSSRKVSAQ